MGKAQQVFTWLEKAIWLVVFLVLAAGVVYSFGVLTNDVTASRREKEMACGFFLLIVTGIRLNSKDSNVRLWTCVIAIGFLFYFAYPLLRGLF